MTSVSRDLSRLRRRTAVWALAVAAATMFVSAAASSAQAAEAPAWKLSATSLPTNFAPNTTNPLNYSLGKPPVYELVATNVGSARSSEPITITDTLPAGITPVNAEISTGRNVLLGFGGCEIESQTVTCTYPEPVPPGQWVQASVAVDVGSFSEGSTAISHATVTSPGSASAQTIAETVIRSSPAPFGFASEQNGLNAAATNADGSPATQAGSHPYQLTVDLAPSTVLSEAPVQSQKKVLAGGGGVRHVGTSLPRGLIVNPNSTPVLCTERQLETTEGGFRGCPASSQIGTATVLTTSIGIFPNTTPLYNMVPPPGAPAEFAFDAVGIGIYVHLMGGVRAGDYTLTADSNDILARGPNPLFGVQVQLWGDPSSRSHDSVRGVCNTQGGECPTGDTPPSISSDTVPLLTMPGACSDSVTLDASIDSWLEPGVFSTASGPVIDGNGEPTPVSGCSQLDFSPRTTFQLTTNQAESPSGLDVDLQLPQPQAINANAEAHLKKAVVTVPEGLTLNPSAASGLAGCSEAQIGLTSEAPIRFDSAAPSCPDGSKVGTATIDTPLLAKPLQGSLYVASQGDNPFHTLLAGYLVAQGPGVTIKLAGRFDPDPATGQITATFDNNPQLPFSDLTLHLKEGSRGVLITPPRCGNYQIQSNFSSWSAADPNNPTPSEIVRRTNTLPIGSGPGGGACPAPGNFTTGFEAGTAVPLAGAYSPFVLKLSREDGSQRLAQIDTTLPKGLLGRLAGIPYCSPAALAVAAAREVAGQGIVEQVSPSCPAASQVGSVDIAAGAGPTPYHVSGRAYLAGPYKGAPLSLAIITPAIAGPFDLGSVLVRTALYVDPATAQIHAVSDPLPQILHGIPLDLRSVALSMDRPNFTLNPTSCDPKQITGQAISALGVATPLQSRFQVGGCAGLPFKPRLSLRLTGATRRTGNPALHALLTQPAGQAGIGEVSTVLPKTEFIDNAHINSPCTRVQFDAGACPPKSILGRARAWSPLLDEPLEGPVYFRSNGGERELPDLVADLNGQIHVTLVGFIDAVQKKGSDTSRVRTRFLTVPDAPVSKFTLDLVGGKKGLLENSANLCKVKNVATIKMIGQNGAAYDTTPTIATSCGKKKKAGQGSGRHARR